jgi:hypothetical protein
VEDLQARLEKLLTDAEDCARIAKRTTDEEKRDLFDRLATDLRSMASDLQAMIALKRVRRTGDVSKSDERQSEGNEFLERKR